MNFRLEEKTDEELATLAQGNNEDAFGVLIDRYQGRLLRYGRKFLSNPDNIEDIVQDVFIKTYENLQSFDATRKFSPWMYRIAHNSFVNALRKKHREPVIFIDFDAFVAHPAYEYDPAQEEDRKLMQKLMQQGLEALSSLYKEIIILYYSEELSYREIADVLRIPIGTVGIRLRRAREALRKKVLRDTMNSNENK